MNLISAFQRSDLQPSSWLRGARDVQEPISVEWSPRTLRALLAKELPDTEILVVSNREPYIHDEVGGSGHLQVPASGLVSALEPVTRACGGTWIAHGSGQADRAYVDGFDREAVPPHDPSYTLRRVWLSEEEQDGYYFGFANEGIWPLCHLAYVRPTFRETDWQTYVAVNRRFADVVVEEATTEDPIVLVQDYHLALLPRFLRQRLPKATILTFWHIPWPSAEAFGICPWKEEIVHGLLGSTILGFHTRHHCNNFLETSDRFIESRIDRERASVNLDGNETFVTPYPISITWPLTTPTMRTPIARCRKVVRSRLGLPPETCLVVGVERLDYTKGIPERLHAVDDFLTRHPEWKGRFAFCQAAAPSRTKLASYRALHDEVVKLAAAINEKHGGDGFDPVHLLVRHHEPDEVTELFRAADACLVTSLHDGMNLVAKEFVASRDDGEGVLVLSGFTGAARELTEAIIVNPFDARETGDAIHRAITMPTVEQRERMRLMRAQVRDRNIYRWAGQMLSDAARLRRRQHVAQIAEMSADTICDKN